MKVNFLFSIICLYYSTAQKITTVQLNGVHYYISRMNPYSSEMNFFLAYKYCRSFGLQLVSFEKKEKVDLVMEYLKYAGFSKYDFWTSGNNLGTNRFSWMSTGQLFNSSFNYMQNTGEKNILDLSLGIASQTSYKSFDKGSTNRCVALSSPTFIWIASDCMSDKHFICEQTRCNYYNYDEIPSSAIQGNLSYFNKHTSKDFVTSRTVKLNEKHINYESSDTSNNAEIIDQVVNNHNITQAVIRTDLTKEVPYKNLQLFNIPLLNLSSTKTKTRSNIAYKSVFNTSGGLGNNIANKDNISRDSTVRKNNSFTQIVKLFKQNGTDNRSISANEEYPTTPFEVLTIGPYDSGIQDYQADEGESVSSQLLIADNTTNDDTSTVVAETGSSYKYNIKVRNEQKVLDTLPQ